MSKITIAYNRIFRALFKGRGRSNQHHIDIPVHGSCSRCHHFHINCLVPHDTTAHTRFRCEQCGHQMFGLGTSTTQYTLASVNTGTMVIPRECVEGQPRDTGSQGETVAVEDVQDTSTHSPNPNHQLSLAANQVAESPEQPQHEHMKERRRHTMKNRLKQWFLRPREWSFSIRATVRRLSSTARDARPPAGPAPHTTNDISVSASSPSSVSRTSPRDPAGDASESVTGPEPPSFRHHTNQPGEPPRERLRILRHGKTKQRESSVRLQCLCGQNCFCRSEGSHASNVAYIGSESESRMRSHMQMEETRSPPQLDVPGPTLSGSSSEINGSLPSRDMPQETSFLGMGTQFDEHRSSSPDTLGLIAENSQRRSRFSQTPTSDTNGSSVTLPGRITSTAARNQTISSTPSNPTPEPDVRHRLPANPYNETSTQSPADRGLARAFELNGEGLASIGLSVGVIQHDTIIDPHSIPLSQASSGSNPRHDSRVDYGYNAGGTSLQVDGIASEHTAEEESEEDTSTR